MLFDDGSVSQILAGMMVSLTCVVVYYEVAPFVEPSDNSLASLSSLSLFCTQLAALLLWVDVSQTEDGMLGGALVAINLGVVFAAVAFVYIDTRTTLEEQADGVASLLHRVENRAPRTAACVSGVIRFLRGCGTSVDRNLTRTLRAASSQDESLPPRSSPSSMPRHHTPAATIAARDVVPGPAVYHDGRADPDVATSDHSDGVAMIPILPLSSVGLKKETNNTKPAAQAPHLTAEVAKRASL